MSKRVFFGVIIHEERGLVFFWGKDIDNKYRSLRQGIKRIGDRTYRG